MITENVNEKLEILYNESVKRIAETILENAVVSDDMWKLAADLKYSCGKTNLGQDIMLAMILIAKAEEDADFIQASSEDGKILRIESSAISERDKALVEALLAPFRQTIEGIQRKREERYQEMIDELPPIESPMSRRR